MSILEVKNLTHTYDGNTPFMNDAVKNVNFSIEKGEIVGIIGHTGSGKSTLVQHLNGLLKPTDGEVLLDGKNIWVNPKKIRTIRSRVGLVFQYPEYQLFEETVYKDIAFGPKNMGLDDNEISTRINDICELVGIKSEYLEKSPFDLSGGEKRRVAIAGVLAMNPDIIIFDEATSMLDPDGVKDVIALIEHLRKNTNKTIITITHDLDLARKSDKILVFKNGQITASGTPAGSAGYGTGKGRFRRGGGGTPGLLRHPGCKPSHCLPSLYRSYRCG